VATRTPAIPYWWLLHSSSWLRFSSTLKSPLTGFSPVQSPDALPFVNFNPFEKRSRAPDPMVLPRPTQWSCPDQKKIMSATARSVVSITNGWWIMQWLSYKVLVRLIRTGPVKFLRVPIQDEDSCQHHFYPVFFIVNFAPRRLPTVRPVRCLLLSNTGTGSRVSRLTPPTRVENHQETELITTVSLGSQ
jgi:hypothetical protein